MTENEDNNHPSVLDPELDSDQNGYHEIKSTEQSLPSKLRGMSRSFSSTAPNFTTLKPVIEHREQTPKVLTIKDALHGIIRIDDQDIIRIIDTKQFQRLRYLKQLGFVEYVFPGATHNRFQHSIGAYHISCKMIRALKQKGFNIPKPMQKLIKISSLCHDIGHGPYSHFSDLLYPGRVHEEESVKKLIEINQELKILTSAELLIISKMITKKDENTKKAIYSIVSSTIDCDRLDYLARDAYHTGMPLFQIDYIIECLYVDENGKLALMKKGYDVAKHMLYTREYMYNNVYHHHTVRDIENFVRQAIINERIYVDPNGTDLDFMCAFMKTPSYDKFVKRDWQKVYTKPTDAIDIDL